MSDEITQAVGAPLERQVRPRAWASSVEWRTNQLLSAAQYGHCLPKNRADFDVPLYDQTAIDAAVAAERERCAAICDARSADHWRAYSDKSSPHFCDARFEAFSDEAEECAKLIRGDNVGIEPPRSGRLE